MHGVGFDWLWWRWYGIWVWYRNWRGGTREEELVSVWGWSLIVGSGWVLVWIGDIPEELLSELIWSPLGIDECSCPVDGAELDEEDIGVKFW